MISILTPTIRPEGLDIVKLGLDRQTIPYDEWLIGSPFEPKVGKWIKDGFAGGYWTFNREMNKLIKEAKGDFIVSIQDYTFFYPDALERFEYFYKQNPNTIISGVGDKYEQVYPDRGKKVWTDPRRVAGNGDCPFYAIEGNFCAFPKQAVLDVGGFDENLDFVGFGLDFYSLFDRIGMLNKYKFYLDTTNESFSLVHGRVNNWDKDNISAGQYIEIHNKYMEKPVLSYLP